MTDRMQSPRPKPGSKPRSGKAAAIDQEQFLTYKISLLARLIERRTTPWLARNHGLTLCDWRILGDLYVSSPASVRYISGSMNIDKGDVSHACAQLIAAGLVARRENPADRRSPTFEITRRGRSLHGQILPHRQREQVALFGCLGKHEAAVMHRTLDRLTNSIAPFRFVVPPGKVPKVHHFLTYKISLLNKLQDRLAVPWFSEQYDISFAEWRVLAHLAPRPSRAVQDIARSMYLDKGGISRACSSLLARGYLNKKDNPIDRRSVLLQPSARGRALYEQILPFRMQSQEKLVANIPKGDLSSFHKSMDKLIERWLKLADG
jgi:DNA-binding MarR family transcriptional regulator